jgi:hypothetical protein
VTAAAGDREATSGLDPVVEAVVPGVQPERVVGVELGLLERLLQRDEVIGGVTAVEQPRVDLRLQRLELVAELSATRSSWCWRARW